MLKNDHKAAVPPLHTHLMRNSQEKVFQHKKPRSLSLNHNNTLNSPIESDGDDVCVYAWIVAAGEGG